MAFNFDIGNPGDSSIVSQFPANERSFRSTVNSWVQTEHDLNGRHVLGQGSVAARNAITTFGVGNLWFNTDTTPATLQRCTVAGSPATFENIGANQTITGPGSSTNTDIVTWNGATGTILADSGVQIGTGANNVLQLNASGQIPAIDGSLLTNLAWGMSVFNSSGSYTPPTGINSVWVTCVGGGGGGGGCAAGSNSGGGGAGATAGAIVAVTPGTPVTVTVGTGGNGGAAGANAGANGGNTSFGASVVAAGGTGAPGSSATISAGGAGGTTAASTGTLLVAGGTGESGRTGSQGGAGGHSSLGGGAPMQPSNNVAGNNATVVGGGGGGTTTGSATAGGNGFAGICVVIALR